MSVYPTHDPDYDPEHIRTIAGRIGKAKSKGELAEALVHELNRYTLFDLQIIGGRLNSEVERLPSPYREAVLPYFREQLFGRHHRLMEMHRARSLGPLEHIPLRDPDLVEKFWAMVPEGCSSWNDTSERNPYFQNPKNRLFYYLIAAFTMFVLDEPGHPVGMPFPGGFFVEQRGKEYYCLIRDKEKDVFYSICNFCPARQSEDPVRKTARR